MQQCENCPKIYDESEYAFCPFCTNDENSHSGDEHLYTIGPGGISMIICSECDGEGFDGTDESKVCAMCDGTGYMPE